MALPWLLAALAAAVDPNGPTFAPPHRLSRPASQCLADEPSRAPHPACLQPVQRLSDKCQTNATRPVLPSASGAAAQDRHIPTALAFAGICKDQSRRGRGAARRRERAGHRAQTTGDLSHRMGRVLFRVVEILFLHDTRHGIFFAVVYLCQCQCAPVLCPVLCVRRVITA